MEGEGVGRYLKILLFTSTVYALVGLITSGSAGSTIDFSPPSGAGFFAWAGWLVNVVGTIIGSALSVMTLPFLPDAIRIPLSIVLASMFVYGLVGLIANIIKLVKPFG